MKALTRKQLTALRATIKGFAAESQNIRKKYIMPNRGEKRAEAWSLKRAVGHYARIHLLAYGFMRGMNRMGMESLGAQNQTFCSDTWHLRQMAKEILTVCRFYGSYRVTWCRS